MGILLSASYEKQTFNAAKKGKHLDKLKGFRPTGMAENNFNPDNEILISDEAPSYWFYSDDEDHRFNEVVKLENGFKCKRTVGKAYDVKTKKSLSLKEINAPLYLVFISYKKGENITDRIEVQRRCIKINWEG